METSRTDRLGSERPRPRPGIMPYHSTSRYRVLCAGRSNRLPRIVPRCPSRRRPAVPVAFARISWAAWERLYGPVVPWHRLPCHGSCPVAASEPHCPLRQHRVGRDVPGRPRYPCTGHGDGGTSLRRADRSDPPRPPEDPEMCVMVWHLCPGGGAVIDTLAIEPGTNLGRAVLGAVS
jgi:hypothetical protein